MNKLASEKLTERVEKTTEALGSLSKTLEQAFATPKKVLEERDAVPLPAQEVHAEPKSANVEEKPTPLVPTEIKRVSQEPKTDTQIGTVKPGEAVKF